MSSSKKFDLDSGKKWALKKVFPFNHSIFSPTFRVFQQKTHRPNPEFMTSLKTVGSQKAAQKKPVVDLV